MSANKKLSLEERLSLAAKKKGKKKSKNNASKSTTQSPTTAKSLSPKPESSPVFAKESSLDLIDNAVELKPVVSPRWQNDETTATSAVTEHIDDGSASHSLSFDEDLKFYKDWLPSGYEKMTNKDILVMIEPYLQQYIEKRVKKVADDSSLMKLVREKDQTVEKLINEKKVIEKDQVSLQKENSKLNNKLNDLKTKRDDFQSKYNEKLKSLDTIVKKLKDSNEENESLKTKIIDNDSLQKDLSKRNNDIESLKENINNLEIEINQKDRIIEEQKEKFSLEIKTLKETSNDQVTLLESNLEQLRIQLENSKLGDYDSYNGDRSKKNNSSTTKDNLTNDQVESAQKQYTLLQEQFDSSKANWESIEFSLNSKLSTLQNNLNESKDQLELITGKYNKSNDTINQLKQTVEGTNKLLQENKETITILQRKNQSLTNSLEDVTNDYILLQKKYEIQKNQLQDNIDNPQTNVEKNKQSPDNVLSNIHSTQNQDILDKFESEWSLNLPKRGDSNSILEESSLRGLNAHDDNIHDLTLTDPGLLNIDSRNNSLLCNNLEDIPEEASQLNELLNKRNSSVSLINAPSYRRTSASASAAQFISKFPNSTENLQGFVQPPSAGTLTGDNTQQELNTQLVSRLGSEIRRMEGELTSLQQSYDQLKEEKNLANEEILKLVEENDTVKRITSQNDKLQSDIKTLQAQLETSLQLLGEKTERNEELENDVEDLKEMMQQQVQQMIEMQGRL